MNNHSDNLALTLLKMSSEIITLLKSNATLDLIIDKMNTRDELVLELQNAKDKITNSDVMLELIRLRNDEQVLLKPFMAEFQDVRQALIHLNQSATYRTSDL